MKLKCYVITISKNFPQSHKRSGEETAFYMKILAGIKIHTIRSNFDLWSKRIGEIQAGRAYLSIREWTGKPYRSPQKELFQFHKKDGVGIQPVILTASKGEKRSPLELIEGIGARIPEGDTLAINDGLTAEDFNEWFKSAKPYKPMAIIHFTSFRYGK